MPRKTETNSTPEVIETDIKETVAAVPETADTEAAGADKTEVKAEEPKEKKKPGRKPGRKPGSTNKKTEKSEKPEKGELVPEVFVEYQGQSVTEASVIDKVKAAYVSKGHRASSIKSLQLYMKPEDFKAYYVINGKLSGEVDLF